MRAPRQVLSSRVYRTIAVASECCRETAKEGERLGIEVYGLCCILFQILVEKTYFLLLKVQ
jgi:hypothetical protein